MTTVPVVNEPESKIIKLLYKKSIKRANQKLNRKEIAVNIEPKKQRIPILETIFALSLPIQYFAPNIEAKIPIKPIKAILFAMKASLTETLKWLERKTMQGNVQLLNPNNSYVWPPYPKIKGDAFLFLKVFKIGTMTLMIP